MRFTLHLVSLLTGKTNLHIISLDLLKMHYLNFYTAASLSRNIKAAFKYAVQLWTPRDITWRSCRRDHKHLIQLEWTLNGSLKQHPIDIQLRSLCVACRTHWKATWDMSDSSDIVQSSDQKTVSFCCQATILQSCSMSPQQHQSYWLHMTTKACHHWSWGVRKHFSPHKSNTHDRLTNE